MKPGAVRHTSVVQPGSEPLMFDHLSLGVSNLEAAGRFYDALFAPLGAAKSLEKPTEIAYGPAGETSLFWLYPVEGARISGLGTHVAFTAGSRDAVNWSSAA